MPTSRSGRRRQVRDQARGCRLAVDAGDGDERDAAGLPVGEEQTDDGLADRPRLSGGRLQVHPQARPGVDLDDGAALLLQRPADVHGDDIDAGDVQADGAGRLDGARGRFRMNPIGYVGCGAAGAEVAVAADEHALPGWRHRIRRVTLLGQHRQADRVELDEAQHRGVAVAAARIAVDLGDELRDASNGRRRRRGPARAGRRR